MNILNGTMESVKKGVISTSLDLTKLTYVEVKMAEPSLPKNLSINNLTFSDKPAHPRFRDLEKQRFGQLFVLGFKGSEGLNRLWYCLCDCGKVCVRSGNALQQKSVRSCGCFGRLIIGQRSRTHGHSKSATYKIWGHMKSRCSNPNVEKYKDYGGRGIQVCKRWEKFENFLADMGEKPGAEYSIERKDNSKGYSPDNCKWALRIEQANNTRTNRLITFNRKTYSLAVWCRRLGLNYPRTLARLDKLKWSIKKAFVCPRQNTGARGAIQKTGAFRERNQGNASAVYRKV